MPTEFIQEIDRPLERGTAFVRASYAPSEALTFYAEGFFGKSTSTVVNSYNRHQTANPFTIQRDNAYLPVTLRNQMTAAGVTSLTMLRFSRERGFVSTKVDSETYRGVVGVDGKLGSIKLGAYYQYGQTIQDNATLNDEINARFTQAIDAVVNPATNQVVCRSTLTNPANGCVPFNVFGEGAPSSAALDYTRGVSSSHAVVQQDVAAVNASGPLFAGWAGPISFAIGGEYRVERARVGTDDLSPTGAFLFGNPTPWTGRYDVKEAFVEGVVPLLRDLPFARELELNAAGRITDYSTSGEVETWKVGLSWKPFDGLRLRGTRSRDIRAPNLSELFQTGRQSTASVTDTANNNVRITGIPQINTGNPSLTPEIATTWTAGAVISPTFAPELNVSVDYYTISIRDAIGTIAAQTAVDQCVVGVPAACALITRNAAGTIVQFTAYPINLASAKTNGVDVELGYRIPPRQWFGLHGTLFARALVSYVGKQETTTPGAVPLDRAGEVGVNPYPYWRGTAQLNYDTDHVGAFLQARYVGGGRYDVTRGPTLVDLQHVAGQAYLDGQISYRGAVHGANVELFLNLRNLLNTAPPISPQDGNVPVAVNTSLYDVLGRVYRVGARFRY